LRDAAELVGVAGELVFAIEVSSQHAAKAVRSIQSRARRSALRRARGHMNRRRFLRGVSITAHAIKRKAGSRCEMSCAPYAA